MSQTPVLARTDTPIFDQLLSSFQGASTGLTYTDLVAPFDITPPSLRMSPPFVPQPAIPHEDKIDTELAAVGGRPTKAWPNYNQQLAEISAKAQEAVSGTISVKDRRGIALVETPHHFKTQAEKDAETAEFIVPPLPAEPPTIGVRKLSLIKSSMAAPTREERLGLDRRSPVKPLAEKAVQAPVDFHKGVLALAEEALDRDAITAFKEDDTVPVSKIEDGLGTQLHEDKSFLDTAFAKEDMPITFAPEPQNLVTSLMAEYRSAQRVVGRMDHSILSGLHAAAEKVRKLGTDNPPMHPQDAANYDATFGGKYMQAPVEYVGSDTVEMALPMKE